MFRDYLLLLVYAVILVCFTNIATQFNEACVTTRELHKKTTQTTFQLHSYLTFCQPRNCSRCLFQRSRRLSRRRPGTTRRILKRKRTLPSTPKASSLSCSWHPSTLACSWCLWYVTSTSYDAGQVIRTKEPYSDSLTGQTHRQHRHPSNHERLQIARRHRLVWHGLLAHQRRFPVAFRKALQVRSDQGDFPGFHSGVRGWLDCLRCGSELDCIYYRPSDCWCGSWRSSLRCRKFPFRSARR